MDKQLNDLRRRRWERAFADGNKDDSQKDTNLRATIVIEHIIQASDVSHTMQHWHVYRKWNERLFEEVYKAYVEGRTDNDPSIGWYVSFSWVR
jgi:3'5'-cyclic nucleotide phosphodiesterase